jgi:hypothetical protein
VNGFLTQLPFKPIHLSFQTFHPAVKEMYLPFCMILIWYRKNCIRRQNFRRTRVFTGTAAVERNIRPVPIV